MSELSSRPDPLCGCMRQDPFTNREGEPCHRVNPTK